MAEPRSSERPPLQESRAGYREAPVIKGVYKGRDMFRSKIVPVVEMFDYKLFWTSRVDRTMSRSLTTLGRFVHMLIECAGWSAILFFD